MKRFIVTIILALLASTALCAAGQSVYLCPRVTAPPVIDGKLDDAAWRSAAPIELVLSETGNPATKKTIAKMCWDSANLYVSFDCADSDIYGTYMKRDDIVYVEEVVEVYACPDCNIKSYYEMNVSPRNVQFDSKIFDPVDGHPNQINTWDCKGLRTAVVVDGTLDNRTDIDRGWSAEYAIPFAGLDRPTPKLGERWRLNLYRIDLSPKPQEFQAWSPTFYNPAAFHVPERFGTVFFTGCGK